MRQDKRCFSIKILSLLYPEKNAKERLTIFFKKLKELTLESKRKNDWLYLKDIHINEDTTIEEKITGVFQIIRLLKET